MGPACGVPNRCRSVPSKRFLPHNPCLRLRSRPSLLLLLPPVPLPLPRPRCHGLPARCVARTTSLLAVLLPGPSRRNSVGRRLSHDRARRASAPVATVRSRFRALRSNLHLCRLRDVPRRLVSRRNRSHKSPTSSSRSMPFAVRRRVAPSHWPTTCASTSSVRLPRVVLVPVVPLARPGRGGVGPEWLPCLR